MPTYPNQRMIKVHREQARSDFLGIKNENWQSASRDLGAHALQLYLYLASNANNYTLALSPLAVRQAIGMARSTYHDQFHKLIDKGYIVPAHGNTFDFYEVPQAATQTQSSLSDVGLDFEENPPSDIIVRSHGQSVLPEDTEIYNKKSINNPVINNIVNQSQSGKNYDPVVTEIRIPPPAAGGRYRPTPREQPKKEVFDF